MKTFEEIINTLNVEHNQKIEKLFEKELLNQMLLYVPDLVIDFDTESYIPVFTDEKEAEGLNLVDKLFASTVDAIPNPKDLEYVLNPLNQAIIFDSSIWNEGSFEVLGTNRTELSFMMRSKAFFESTHIEEAYLINARIDGKTHCLLIVDSMPKTLDAETKFIEALSGIMEGSLVNDIYSLEDPRVLSLVKGIKPYYKK